MGASYWARWACNGQVADLPDLVLPHVLAEGYDLLAFDGRRQSFDRGGVMKKISWSLNGGSWQNAPLDLAITYTCSPTQTVAEFSWKLLVRPFPISAKEQAVFEATFQQQANRIIARLNQQLGQVSIEQDHEIAEEGAALQACWESTSDTLQDTRFAPSVDTSLSRAVALVSTVSHRTSVHRSRLQIDGTPHCDLCHSPAVPVVGTHGRYFCLICRHHLPHEPAA